MYNNFRLSVSTRNDKKYMVSFISSSTGNINTLHFGAKGYGDFTLTHDKERKRLYKLRHKNDNINDLYSAGCWSWWLLWNKPTLTQSIQDMEENFKINIFY